MEILKRIGSKSEFRMLTGSFLEFSLIKAPLLTKSKGVIRSRPLVITDCTMIPSPLELYNHAKVVYDYLKDVKDAGDDRANLLGETVAMQTLLKQLESHADEPDWKATMEALRAPRGPFDQLELELKRMESKLRPTGKLKKAGKALMWHWTKDDVKKRCERIERIKGLLQIALQNNNRLVRYKDTLISENLRKRFRRMWGM
jgi:hypothetical protein